LPGSVREVFVERLRQSMPLRADRVLRRIRETRGGKLNDPRFGSRGTGEGPYAEAILSLFRATAERLGFRMERLEPNPGSSFRRPRGQLDLFPG
jgi:DNA repair photolyase